MSEIIPFDCATCHKAVGGIIDHISWYPCDDGEDAPAVLLTKCPICSNPTLVEASRERIGPYQEWYDARRVWPEPDKCLAADNMPTLIKKDLQDAIRSYNSQIYSACVVLCGRTLERIVLEKASERTIHKGLNKLRDLKIIDERLYDWADALRQQRNIGAHASEIEVTKENASDVLDFLIAICEYIYVLTEKFESFKKRRDAIPGKSAQQEDAPDPLTRPGDP